jgi:N6-adenosine-specific RNA methylase IME4
MRAENIENGGPWSFGTLQPRSYKVIVADPPLKFETWSSTNQDRGKGACARYKLMELARIMALPVGALADRDAVLFLWCPGWALVTGQAQSVARAWDFEPKAELVWRKVTVNGKPRWRTGYQVRSLHECVLLCTHGQPSRIQLPSLFDGIAREHSRKPDEFYMLVRERTGGQRRADLFAREHRLGFEGWGDELGKFKSLSR